VSAFQRLSLEYRHKWRNDKEYTSQVWEYVQNLPNPVRFVGKAACRSEAPTKPATTSPPPLNEWGLPTRNLCVLEVILNIFSHALSLIFIDQKSTRVSSSIGHPGPHPPPHILPNCCPGGLHEPRPIVPINTRPSPPPPRPMLVLDPRSSAP